MKITEMKLNFKSIKRSATRFRITPPVAILILIISFLTKQSFGQTATINIDFTGSTGITCGGSDNTYANGTGSVNFNGGVPAGNTITGISVSANVGEFLNGTTTLNFSLNGTAIGNINGVTNTCQTGNFNAGTIPTYNNTGTNTLSFTGSGTGTRGVYNATLTVTYTCATALPGVTTPVYFCQSSTASALTATGSNLLWYTSSTGGTGSSTAPTPGTSTVGTTSYYVSQTAGCEGPRAEIDVVIRALPVSSVTGQTNITCYAANDGTITVSASGGSSPYTFSVDNGGTYLPATGTYLRLFTGLLPNTPYRIKVKDNNGCESK